MLLVFPPFCGLTLETAGFDTFFFFPVATILDLLCLEVEINNFIWRLIPAYSNVLLLSIHLTAVTWNFWLGRRRNNDAKAKVSSPELLEFDTLPSPQIRSEFSIKEAWVLQMTGELKWTTKGRFSLYLLCFCLSFREDEPFGSEKFER